MRNFRRPAVTLSLVLVLVMVASLVASAQSTSKSLSTNFTLVNLATGSNLVNIQYYKQDGNQWRPSESETMPSQGSQLIRRQYDDSQLTSGSGSVVVGGSGPMGAVVQIQTRSGTATRAAYSGVSSGASKANVPFVARKLASASGEVNSQMIIQNTGTSATTAEVEMISAATGASVYKKTGISIPASASFTYDLNTETNVPAGFFGSAVVTAGSGGQVAVVSNLFSGSDTLQTYNAFTSTSQEWLAPLFTSRLANTLSTPIAVQNLSGVQIPVSGITVSCIKDPSSPGSDFSMQNKSAVGNTATYFFNPVTDNTIPGGWFGACRITTTGYDTVAFVQMRVVSGAQAGAYEAIKGDGTKTKVVVPLYAKRLGNGFASVVTIQNLSKTSAANVTLKYTGASGLPANCTATINATIPASGSLQQNHRIESGAQSVPQIGNGCYGTIVVESTNSAPIDGIVQLTDISGLAGDTFQVHNAFAID